MISTCNSGRTAIPFNNELRRNLILPAEGIPQPLSEMERQIKRRLADDKGDEQGQRVAEHPGDEASKEDHHVQHRDAGVRLKHQSVRKSPAILTPADVVLEVRHEMARCEWD